MIEKYLNRIIHGNSLENLKMFPKETIDMVFADPPYNLQLNNDLLRPDQSFVSGVKEDWDRFNSFDHYDKFTEEWLRSIKEILKPNGTIWVIGSYHNIFRLGYILQNLGFWILNDVIWTKTNPMPNFRGKRFTNAHETLIWASKNKKSKYTFNYEAMKSLNGDLQMRSDWSLPICTGNERLKNQDGIKIHPTQKPESLLTRVVMSSSKINDTILDPFFGTGTTGVVAKRLKRNYVGMEENLNYIKEAKKRIKSVNILNPDEIIQTLPKKSEPRIPFGSLVEKKVVSPGELLTDYRKRWVAKVRADGSLISDKNKGSIHSVGAALQGLPACNGWTFWHIKRSGKLIPIDNLRLSLRMSNYSF